ncbi:MAG: outer membrane beta-barrel protein [Ignavibacteriales bacterium]|nr:outer membrane beta-barrel protein [Ignavibacteriales bacterium]
MKKILVILFVLMFAGFTFGQGKMAIGIQGNLAIPMGDFGDAYDMGFGGLLSFYYNVNPNIGIGLNTGYQTWSATNYDNYTSSSIPVLAAFKYSFGKGSFLPYLALGVGGYYSMVSYEYTILGVTYSGDDSEFNFGVNGGLGFVYQTSPSLGIDVGVKFSNIFSEGSSTNFIDINAGVLVGI